AEEEWEECLLKGNFLTKSRAEFQLIETLLWQPEQGYFLLDYHLERLQDTAHYFHFYCDVKEVKQALQATATDLRKKSCNKDGQKWRVRLLLYRDGGLEISTTPLKESAQQGKALVFFSPEQVDSYDPHRFHKTTQRELYTREFQRATEQGYYDILFTNRAEEVTEGAITTVFIRRKQGEPLLTPPVLCGLLPGTYRRMLLEQGKAVEQVLSKEDLVTAEELYVANAVRGLVPVCLVQIQEK
ncbi:MAG: aminodeoxychorismate synthase, component I, partial [Candidatus Electrothrix sp. MAN1_4]|nr:aminodeoxychorismate synthase, component I [Candidatus Electrothrix sp. MAN1_4]